MVWALHPIQTQAVTYIVQRMGSLCGMFYIIGIYCFIRFLLSNRIPRMLGWGFLFFIWSLLCVGSKQNGVLIYPSALLIDYCFGGRITACISREKKYLWVGAAMFAISLALLYFSFDLENVLSSGYLKRSYTCYQRLLTETRVIFIYLGQIFYPVATRFSLVHDVQPSLSLLSPWTTWLCVGSVFVIIVFTAVFVRKKPLYLFPIAFYFLNHLVESTIIPLELVYEHRNYIPTLFLFIPLGMLFLNYCEILKKTNRRPILAAFFGAIIILSLSIATYTRNMDWKNDKTLWESALAFAPNMNRPYVNLALAYAEKSDLDIRKQLLLSSRNKYDDSRGKSDYLTSMNLGSYYLRIKDYDKAYYEFKKSVVSGYYNDLALHNIASVYAKQKKWDKVLETLLRLTDSSLRKKKCLMIAYAMLTDYDNAMKMAYEYMNIDKTNPVVLSTIATIYAVDKDYKKSNRYINFCRKLHPSLEIDIIQIDLAIEREDHAALKKEIKHLFGTYSLDQIKKYFYDSDYEYTYVLLNRPAIQNMILSAENCNVNYVDQLISRDNSFLFKDDKI